jgi:hypothetical protein
MSSPISYAAELPLMRLLNDRASSLLKNATENIASFETKLGQFGGLMAYGLEVTFTPIGKACYIAAEKTVTFVKNNWKPLMAYIFAWMVIITCTGLMYGFKAVALPLTIGLGCGLIFGVITGILAVEVFDPEGKITLWNLLNQVIEKLDPNGTRQIVLSVAVTVLLAASIVFPYVMGAVFGIFAGNQMATKAGSGQNLGKEPSKNDLEKEKLKTDISSMQKTIEDFRVRMEKIEQVEERQGLSQEIGHMLLSLQEMQAALERIYSKTENAV